jgi:hypothetical protein
MPITLDAPASHQPKRKEAQIDCLFTRPERVLHACTEVTLFTYTAYCIDISYVRKDTVRFRYVTCIVHK